MKYKYLMTGYLVLALAAIWLLAKLWLPTGYLLAGHDSGLALSAKEFFNTRLFAWDIQDFGYDNSPHFGSLVLHGIDYLTAFISKTPYAGNRLNVFLWFSMIFTGLFIFAYKLRDKLGRFTPIFFPVFVTFNFFILQSVFILERAKYSVLLSSLILFGFLIELNQTKINLISSSIITSIALTIFNSGSWLGLPLYGGIFVLVLSAFVFEIIWGISEKNFLGLKRLTIYLLLTGLFFLLLNSYSIVPYLATFFKQDYLSLTSTNVISVNKSWLESLSQAGSFINFFRLQGVPDWYASPYSINTAHSYASIYSSNPGLIFVSLTFSILAFWSLTLAKTRLEKRTVSFLGLTTLLSMIFMAGSHEPFGKFYEFLFLNLPGFAIFRSPFFKFGSIFFIAVSGMIAFTLSFWISNILSNAKSTKRIVMSVIMTLLALSGWVFYYNPIFDSKKIFDWQTGYSTRVTVPNYIESFEKQLDKTITSDERVLLTPPLNFVWGNDSYKWGYWSLTNLPSILSNRPFLTNDSTLSKEERSWVNSIYAYLKEGSEEGFIETADRLGIGYVLLRKDVFSDQTSWSPLENPDIYENVINGFKNLNKVSSFGEWDLYKIDHKESRLIDATNDLVSVPESGSYLSRTFIKNDVSVLDNALPGYLDPFIKQRIGIYSCQSCLLETKKIIDFLPNIRILPNSKLYYFKSYKENKTLNVITNDKEKASAYMGFLLRRAAETMSMINSWAKEEEIAANLRVMNSYLDSLQTVLVSTSDGEKDFETASRIIDNLGPIEINFQVFTKRDDFGKKGEELRQQILSVLWKIYNIRKFYSPILSDIERWESEKIYNISFDKKGVHDFYIDQKSLPSGLDNHPIVPSKVQFLFDGKSESVSLQRQNGWLRFSLENNLLGDGTLLLFFDKLPNLFDLRNESLQPLATGEKSCISGMIKNYKPHVPYRILIQSNNINEKLKLIVKDDAKSVSTGNMFLHGENELTIEQDSLDEPFSFLYYPETVSVEPTVFICSSSKDRPDLKSVRVVEIAAPPVIFVNDQYIGRVTNPEVGYKKIDSTKYVVKIENAPESYILTFNQRYNPYWKITNNGTNISQDQHFMVNGYANAWRIDIPGSYELTLEYSIQKLFYAGLLVSGTTLVILVSLLIKIR